MDVDEEAPVAEGNGEMVVIEPERVSIPWAPPRVSPLEMELLRRAVPEEGQVSNVFPQGEGAARRYLLDLGVPGVPEVVRESEGRPEHLLRLALVAWTLRAWAIQRSRDPGRSVSREALPQGDQIRINEVVTGFLEAVQPAMREGRLTGRNLPREYLAGVKRELRQEARLPRFL